MNVHVNGRSVEHAIKKLISDHPQLSAAVAGGLLGGGGEAANIYFSLNPSDVGQREYERRIKRNFMRGLFTGGAAGLAGAHVYDKITSPSFQNSAAKSAMITIKFASVGPADAKPGQLLQSAIAKLRGSPLLQSVLASGALGATTGGVLTAMAPKRDGEDRSSRRKRIIRNALLMGAMSGGGVGALGLATKNLSTALPANDQGSPVAQSLRAGARIAPGAAVVGLRGHSRFKDEQAGAEGLMQQLRSKERSAGSFSGSWTGKGEAPAPDVKGKPSKSPKPSTTPLGDFFSSQTGVSQTEKGQRVASKGAPSTPGETLRRLFRGRDAELDGEPTLTRHMRNIGGSAINAESLRDAGLNPAYAKANPSMFRKAEGFGSLWKDRAFKNGGGRLGAIGGLAAAGLGAFSPEILSGIYNGAGGAIDLVDGADDKLPQL